MKHTILSVINAVFSGRGVTALIMGVFLFSAPPLYAQDRDAGVLEVKEVSWKDSLQDVLEENKRLKKDKEELEKEVTSLSAKTNWYANKTKALDDRISDLETELKGQRSGKSQDVKRLVMELERLKEENRKLKRLSAKIEMQRYSDEYLKKWQETQAELDSVKAKIEVLSDSRERLVEENGKMHFNLGTMYFKKGDYEKATYEFEQALRFLPNDPDVYYNLAVLYDYYMNDGAKASRYYNLYMQKSTDPNNPLALKERVAENDLRAKLQEKDR